MSRDNRRRQSLFTALFADPYRKLAAIGLAFGLWMVLDNKVSDDHDPTLRIEWVEETFASSSTGENLLLVALPLNKVTPSDVVDAATNEPITQVKVKLRGPKAKIEPYKRGRVQLKVGPFLDTDMEKVSSVTFDRDDLHGADDLRELVAEMSPASVRMNIERNSSATLPVQIDRVDIDLASDAPADLLNQIKRESAVFKPDSVTVSGPASLVNALRNDAKPFRVTIGVPRGDQINAPVRLVNNQRLLRIDGAPAGNATATVSMMTIDVNPKLIEDQFDIPVHVDQLSLPEKHRVYGISGADTIPVTVEYNDVVAGILTLIDSPDEKLEWARANLRVFVQLQAKGTGEEYPAEWGTVRGRLQPVGPLQVNNNAIVRPKDGIITLNLKRQS